MKKIYFLLVFVLLTLVSQAQRSELPGPTDPPQKGKAQIELKTNPIILLFEVFNLGAELTLSESAGVELDVIIGEDVHLGWLSGKYYFKPKMGTDRFYVDTFVLVGDGAAGLGFGAGYKYVSQHGVLWEIGGGLGRDFSDGYSDVLGYFKAQIGYRF